MDEGITPGREDSIVFGWGHCLASSREMKTSNEEALLYGY
jgi:hypothetical protein